MLSCPLRSYSTIGFINSQVQQRNSFPVECLHRVNNYCLLSLCWSEHNMWIQSCLSTDQSCAFCVYLSYVKRPQTAEGWLSQWSTVTAVCGEDSLILTWTAHYHHTVKAFLDFKMKDPLWMRAAFISYLQKAEINRIDSHNMYEKKEDKQNRNENELK